MCQYDVEASNKRKGKDNSLLSSTTSAFDDLINPFQQDTGLGKLASNLNMQNYLNNDSGSSAPEMDTTITPTKVTNLDARQGEIDPRLKKKRRNMNSLRIREDLPTTLTSPAQSQSSGTTTIIT
tara:strand:- start:39 stop:410 length:372 start_codon:yes stop_codon:yes gene_type:complete